MLNVDGGYRHNDKKGAIGGLLRDWNGEPVMVFYQLIHTPVGSLQMECEAIIRGLQKVVRLRINNVILLNDSNSTIKVLNSGSSGNGKHKQLYQTILNFRDKITNLHMLAVFRFAKEAADRLVRMAYDNKEDDLIVIYQEYYFEKDSPDDSQMNDILKTEKQSSGSFLPYLYTPYGSNGPLLCFI
jgi:ribonuclease HI